MQNIKFIKKNIKHLIWQIVNLSLDYIPINSLKVKILNSILKFNINRGSSLHFGLRFYRVGNIEIGENTVINRCCTLDNRGKIKIGSGVSISRFVSIYTSGHFHDESFDLKTEGVEIGDSSVIYSHVIICPGVKLGEGVIVYPGSVVSRGVYGDGSVLSGNPVRVIKIIQVKKRSHSYPHLYAM
jgi:acetyltransferase-like isoleucine patch superfamily enzyme